MLDRLQQRVAGRRARLTHPLRRVGRKGEGRFEPVSWDVALASVAERLNHIVATIGPQAILNTHYSGTISLIAFLFPTRFFNRLGATEVTPDTICNMAGHVALELRVRNVGERLRSAYRRCRCLHPRVGSESRRLGPARARALAREAAGQAIVVDPVRTATAEAADIHLQPFPGSDAALAFSMLHVIRRDGLVDRDFVDGTRWVGTSSNRCSRNAPRHGARRRPACPPR